MTDHEENAAQKSTGAPNRRGRLKRVLIWAGLTLVTLIVVVISGIALALSQLDSPFMKTRIQAAAEDALGTSVDYESIEVGVMAGTLEARGLVIATPAQYAEYAPSLLAIDSVSVDVEPSSMVGEPHIERVSIGGVRVTVVVDEAGSSISLLASAKGGEESAESEDEAPPKPLSELVAGLSKLGIRADEVSITDVTFTLIELGSGGSSRTTTLGPLALSVRDIGAPSDSSGVVVLSAVEDLLLLDSVERSANGETTEKQASVAPRLTISLADGVRVEALFTLIGQDFRPELNLTGPVLALDLKIEAKPESGLVALDLARFDVLGETVRAKLTANLADDTPGTLSSANGTVKLAFDKLPVPVPSVSVDGVDFELFLEDATLSAEKVAGHVHGKGQIKSVTFGQDDTSAQVEAMTWALSVEGEGSLSGGGSLPEVQANVGIGSVQAESGGSKFASSALSLTYAAKPGADAADHQIDLTAKQVAASASGDGVTNGVSLPSLSMRVASTGLVEQLLAGAPLDAAIDVGIPKLEARSGAKRIAAEGLGLRATLAKLALSGPGMFGLGGAAAAELDLASVSLRDPAQVTHVRRLAATTRADFDASKISGELPVGSVQLVDAKTGATTFALAGTELGYSLTHPLSLAPGAPGAATAQISGKIGHLDAGSAVATLDAVDIRAKKTKPNLYTVSVDTDVAGLVLSEKAMPGRRHLSVAGDVDPTDTRADLEVALRGGAGPDVKLALQVNTRGGKTTYALNGELVRLTDVIASYAPEGMTVGVDKITLKGQGHTESTGGKHQLDVGMESVAYAKEALALASQSADLSVTAVQKTSDTGEPLNEITLRGEFPSTEIARGPSKTRVDGLSQEIFVVISGPPEQQTVNVRAGLDVKHVEHAMQAAYPITDVSFRADAQATPRGVALRSLTFANPGAGTVVSLQGTYEQPASRDDGRDGAARDGRDERVEGRKALRLTGTVDQDLEVLSGTEFAKRASGKVRLAIDVQSGELVAYQVAMRVIPEAVSFLSADESLQVDNLNGVIPVEETVTLAGGTVSLASPHGTNPFARTRFFDVRPFLGADDYISADAIRYGGTKLGALAGNLRVLGETFALDRIEVGYREGTITGQLIVDASASDAAVKFRGNITGIRPAGSDQVLDANAAFTFLPETLELTGTMQIVRIGTDHLNEMLDVMDPYRESVNMNRVRKALMVGYPEFMRLTASGALLDAEVKLGGIAGLVRIDPIRDVPLVPIIDRFVGPAIRKLQASRQKKPIPADAPPEPAPEHGAEDRDD